MNPFVRLLLLLFIFAVLTLIAWLMTRGDQNNRRNRPPLPSSYIPTASSHYNHVGATIHHHGGCSGHYHCPGSFYGGHY
ncbi:hypothetical protein EPA93_24955 [Ktedonosporobacter rubrisoli]|uniref:Uncharacterized protein n=1 Tax=Ktedonosporobacter rubrisoli TaxID=2509675 RepID=A0A4P6JTY2_KTERU|nr:hypothetical protein [Ktedonosporobacter rubrisoli]QBD79058.1 hypothetical protein EPA93_24955 [Ktedonosporobacter rubrisoli]